MHYDWALALHHKAHPSAALNSPHYTLGLGIGDQQTKLNIVCVLKQRTFCVCVSLLKSEFTRGFFLCAGHDIPFPEALKNNSSLFSPFMCETDCAVQKQTDEFTLVSLTGPFSLCFFFFPFLPTQAKKEKLQQAGNGNFERIFLLAPQQPVPERGG